MGDVLVEPFHEGANHMEYLSSNTGAPDGGGGGSPMLHVDLKEIMMVHVPVAYFYLRKFMLHVIIF